MNPSTGSNKYGRKTTIKNKYELWRWRLGLQRGNTIELKTRTKPATKTRLGHKLNTTDSESDYAKAKHGCRTGKLEPKFFFGLWDERQKHTRTRVSLTVIPESLITT